MCDTGYTVREFVTDLRDLKSRALDERGLLAEAAELASRLMLMKHNWLRGYMTTPPESAGFPFSRHKLHEEPDHGLWVVAVSWLPRRGPPPHDHGTWAVIAGIEGKEENVIWRRAAGRLVPTDTRIVGPGQLIAFPQGAIHSVVNRGERTSLSLHVYGRNQNHAQRSRFDAETGAETAFKLKIQ